MSTIGVDIGGTKIAAGLLDDNGELQATTSAPTPIDGADAVLAQVIALIDELGGAPTAIGVGAPGLIDPVRGIVESATELVHGWQGARVGPELSRLTGLPVAVDNDVRMFAYAEARIGAGQPFARVLYASIGTGVGGALTEDGALVHGAHHSAGEISHLLVPERGPIPCGCGHFDHLEAVASGPAIAAAAGEATVQEVVDRAAITHAATILGRALAGFVTAIDVDAVVVGGGVARIGADFLNPVADALRAEVRPPGRPMPVLAAALGPHAPVIGAALLARERA
ncbi:MAG TPA: ROK family protein [Pseudonocardiaceae bacterium]|nr:ROK family protein [Pseudonocardiaceae bacterium]